MPEYLTPDEVDERLKLPHGKASRLARRGKLPALILPDGSVRFDADKLQAFLAAREHQPRPAAAGGRP
jgi:excisionase family DNA binding protein